jgi:hypothetical protein
LQKRGCIRLSRNSPEKTNSSKRLHWIADNPALVSEAVILEGHLMQGSRSLFLNARSVSFIFGHDGFSGANSNISLLEVKLMKITRRILLASVSP